MTITGSTPVAGVVGWPITHSLSPLLHNAWLAEAGLPGVYVAMGIDPARFPAFIESLRGGTLKGLNVTLPYKAQALISAHRASRRANLAGAANLLVFQPDGTIFADNTDGEGLMAAFADQAPGFNPAAGPAVILGAGGAARGASVAFLEAGAEVRVVNRTLSKARELADELGCLAYGLDQAAEAFADANALVNATSAALGGAVLDVPLGATPTSTVVMDMVYKPLMTPFLLEAKALGRRTVDGLGMLIGQAKPSFTAFFGISPPETVDVRALALKTLEP